MHTKFGVILTYGDKVTFRTRNALEKSIKGRVTLQVIARKMHIPSLESFGPTVTKLRSEQEMLFKHQ